MHSFLRSILKSFSDFFVRCGIQKAFGGNGILAPFPVPVTNGVMASATLVALCISAYGCMLRSYLPHEPNACKSPGAQQGQECCPECP